MPLTPLSAPNVPEMLARAVAAHGQEIGHRWKQGGAWRSATWEQIGADVEALAAALLERGWKAAQVGGVVSTNRPEWHLVELGIVAAGGVTTAVYPTSPAKDAEWVLGNAAARIVFAENPEQATKVLAVRRHLPELQEVVVIDDPLPGTTAFADFLAQGRAAVGRHREQLRAIRERGRESDLLTIIYTSGTTGPPKGAMLTHGNILGVCRSLVQVVPAGRGDVLLSFLPLAHALERVGGLYLPFSAGATIAFAQTMDTVGADMLDVRPTFVSAVPRFYEKVHARVLAAFSAKPPLARRLASWAVGVGGEWYAAGANARFGLRVRHALADALVLKKIRARVGGRLRYFVSGGAPLSAEVGTFFASCGLTILEGYGATETSAPATINRPDDVAFATVGRALPEIEIRIESDGEILIKGPSVFAGYWQNPEATAAALVDGWYKSGDIGRFDDRGRLMIVDRKKDLIITSAGKNVAPQNLERHFKSDAAIAELVVHGDRRHFLSAILVPEPAHLAKIAAAMGVANLPEAELLAHPGIVRHYQDRIDRLNVELSPFEQIRALVLAVSEFSGATDLLTPTLKVRRRQVEARFKDRLDALYAQPRRALDREAELGG